MTDEITFQPPTVGNDRQVAYCACCRFSQRVAVEGFIECHRQSPAPACSLVPLELARAGNLVAVCAYPVRPELDFCGEWEEGAPRSAPLPPPPSNLVQLPGLLRP